MATTDLLITTLLAVVTPCVLVGLGSLAVRAIRWAKRNRVRAAAMMTGSYLDDVAGGRIAGNDDSSLDSVVDWLSNMVDGLDAGAGAGGGCDGWSGSDFGGSDSGGGDCGGGGDGGYCGGD